MTSRERVRRALQHETLDRIPLDLGSTNCTTVTKVAYDDLKQELGVDLQAVRFIMENFQIVKVDDSVLRRLRIDTRGIFGKPSTNSVKRVIDHRTYVSEWNITYHMPEGGLYYDIVDSPLKDASLGDLLTFEWPDPTDPARTKGLKREATERHRENEYALVGDMVETGIFEPCWYLRGFERFLTDLVLDKDFAHALLRSMLEIQLKRYEGFLAEVGDCLDVVFVGDDLATAESSLLSLELYREMIKPYQKRYFEGIKRLTPARLLYHSCGNIASFLPDLIEIGVDILNPVQVNARGMNPLDLKRAYGESLSFWGAIDTSAVLPRGTLEDVENEVKRRIRELGPSGYVLCPVHDVQPDVPGKNLLAMFDAAWRYGESAGALSVP
jgi:uroporphyrinogen decarboxylase